MQPERLRPLVGFEALSPAALKMVAARARQVSLPARRWLIRPGRALSDHYYLLEGRVRLLDTGRWVVVDAASQRSRRPIYPGAAGIETVTAAQFLRLHPGVLAAFDARAWEAELGVPDVSAEEGSWQRRFLTSPLMQHLAPPAWQRVLRSMTPHDYGAGDVVIAAGAPAACCYVLCAGRAHIRAADGRLLAALTPGQLFGEDALVTGGVRNASVVMARSGRAVSLPAACFERWLLEAVVRPLAEVGTRTVLSLAAGGPPGALFVPPGEIRAAARRLSAEIRYALVGGCRRQRQLAAFLMAERGLDARPVAV